MNTIDQLELEHAQLRRGLALVETTIQIGAPAWPLLEDACVSLSAQLEEHVAREEPFRTRFARRAWKGLANKSATTHREPARQLRTILRGLFIDKNVLPKDTDGVLCVIIQELDEQMEQQEQQLFPAMEQTG